MIYIFSVSLLVIYVFFDLGAQVTGIYGKSNNNQQQENVSTINTDMDDNVNLKVSMLLTENNTEDNRTMKSIENTNGHKLRKKNRRRGKKHYKHKPEVKEKHGKLNKIHDTTYTEIRHNIENETINNQLENNINVNKSSKIPQKPSNLLPDLSEIISLDDINNYKKLNFVDSSYLNKSEENYTTMNDFNVTRIHTHKYTKYKKRKPKATVPALKYSTINLSRHNENSATKTSFSKRKQIEPYFPLKESNHTADNLRLGNLKVISNYSQYNTDATILTQSSQRSTKKRHKADEHENQNIFNNSQNLEDVVGILEKKQLKMKSKKYINFNPEQQDATQHHEHVTPSKHSTENSNILRVSNHASNKSQVNNNAINQNFKKHKNVKFQVKSEEFKILKKVTERNKKSKFNVHYHQKSTKTTKLPKDMSINKFHGSKSEYLNPKLGTTMIAIVRKTKQIFTLAEIPTFSAIDSRLRFITEETDAPRISKLYTQTSNTLGLRYFSGPYSVKTSPSPISSLASTLLIEDDTNDITDEKPESIENDNKIFLIKKKEVIPGSREFTNNSDIKQIFGKDIAEILGDINIHHDTLDNDKVRLNSKEINQLFEREILREKKFSIPKSIVKSSSEVLSELEYVVNDTTLSNFLNRYSIVPKNIKYSTKDSESNIILTTQGYDNSDSNHSDTTLRIEVIENEGSLKKNNITTDKQHNPIWKKMHYLSSYSDEEDLIKKNVRNALNLSPKSQKRNNFSQSDYDNI